jgi:hypothetical protein
VQFFRQLRQRLEVINKTQEIAGVVDKRIPALVNMQA